MTKEERALYNKALLHAIAAIPIKEDTPMTPDFSNLTTEQEYALTAFFNTTMTLVAAWCAEGRPSRINDLDGGLFQALDTLSGMLP